MIKILYLVAQAFFPAAVMSDCFCSMRLDSTFPYFIVNRVKKREDIIGAFRLDPVYLRHESQHSGTVIFPEGALPEI